MGKSTDTTRAERKAKKRAAEAAIPDLPGDSNTILDNELLDKSKKRKRSGDDVEANGEEAVKSKKSKKEKESKNDVEVTEEVVKVKKSKKEKKEKKDKEVEAEVAEPVDTIREDAEIEALKKSERERKAERKVKEAAEAAANGTATTTKKSKDTTTEVVVETNGDAAKSKTGEEKKARKNNRNREKKRKGAVTNGEAGTAEGEEKAKKDARFIVFVGKLPFTANTESITSHFASVHPISVRPLTKKDEPTKCKGCAFVEFAGYDHMKTCLKLMHHSNFDDGKSAPRKINVELTAGGGGNTKERKGKIQEKNAKLNEERIRKFQEEEKAKLVKAASAHGEGKAKEVVAIDESAIHPSRRGIVPSAR